jgi:hypothetical protein
MRRSLSMVGLLALLGCGGIGEEGAASPPTESGALAEVGVAPRVARFTALPAGALDRDAIKPQSWAGPAGAAALPVAGGELLGRFDPAQVKVAEAHRSLTESLRVVR